MEDDIALLSFVNEREKRNVEAWGKNGEEKQELLYASRVMVVGSGVLSQMVLANLTGLGIRNICCIDDKTINMEDMYNFLYINRNKSSLGERRVNHIAATLEAINPLLRITHYESLFEKGHINEFNPEVVIDATNDSNSKNNCLDYCIRESLPFISVASTQKSAVLSTWNPNGNKPTEGLEFVVNHDFPSQHQGSYTSGVIAGLAADQVRKLKFQIEDNGIDEPLKAGQQIVYNQCSDLDNHQIHFENLSALIVGAGAVGNFVALNLALLGVGNIDIIDGDRIEEHNLNRQLLLYGRVGDFKAEVLSERIKEINDSIEGNFYNYYLTKETAGVIEKRNGKKYDVIFGCADTYKARYLINKLAVRHKIPHIDGGSSATSGSVIAYVPGKNRCIDCRLDLKKYAEKEIPKKETSCINNPNPAIVIPNIIIGSVDVAEFVNIISGTPKLLEKIFKYDSYTRNKLYLEPAWVAKKCELNCL